MSIYDGQKSLEQVVCNIVGERKFVNAMWRDVYLNREMWTYRPIAVVVDESAGGVWVKRGCPRACTAPAATAGLVQKADFSPRLFVRGAVAEEVSRLRGQHWRRARDLRWDHLA